MIPTDYVSTSDIPTIDEHAKQHVHPSIAWISPRNGTDRPRCPYGGI